MYNMSTCIVTWACRGISGCAMFRRFVENKSKITKVQKQYL